MCIRNQIAILGTADHMLPMGKDAHLQSKPARFRITCAPQKVREQNFGHGRVTIAKESLEGACLHQHEQLDSTRTALKNASVCHAAYRIYAGATSPELN